MWARNRGEVRPLELSPPEANSSRRPGISLRGIDPPVSPVTMTPEAMAPGVIRPSRIAPRPLQPFALIQISRG